MTHPRRPSLGYGLVLVGVVLHLSAPLGVESDGLVRYQTLEKLMTAGELDAKRYSIAGPICSVPLWHIGEAIGYPKETVGTFNRVVFVLMVGGLWWALRPVLGDRERVRFVLFVLFGSLFAWHVTGFFGELFHAACVGLGLALVATRPKCWWVAWPLVVWGTANVPAAVPALALAVAVLWWHRRKLRYALAVVAPVCLILFENHLRRGSIFDAGYKDDAGFKTVLPFSGQPNFSYPLFFGLLAVLFSFGKGLVFFTPGLFLRYPRSGEDDGEAKLRLVYAMWVAAVAGLVLVFARWWAWYGGAVWGPRFFLLASLPASLVLARLTTDLDKRGLWANAVVLAAVGLSCWAAANGMVFDTRGFQMFWDNDFALEYLTWYVPECSVLWRPFVVPQPLAWYDVARLAAFAVGVAYLAGPVAGAVVRQLWAGAKQGRRALRDGPRFKF